MTFLASFAFVRLRRLSNEVGRLHHDVHTTLCITMGEHIRNNVDELNSMKERLEELLEDERFEDAARLKKIIEHQEHQIELAIARFKKTFGEDTVRVEMTKFRVS
jgi:hypothetical protein